MLENENCDNGFGFAQHLQIVWRVPPPVGKSTWLIWCGSIGRNIFSHGLPPVNVDDTVLCLSMYPTFCPFANTKHYKCRTNEKGPKGKTVIM